MLIYLVVIGVFVLVAMLVFSLASGLDERTARARMLRDRLASLDRAQERGPSEELALLRDELLSEIPALDNVLRRSARVQNLQHFLQQADMQMRAGNFLFLSAFLGLLFAMIGQWLSNRVEMALIFLILGGSLPYLYASYLRTKRF